MARETGAEPQARGVLTTADQARVHPQGQRQEPTAGHLDPPGSGLHDGRDAGVGADFRSRPTHGSSMATARGAVPSDAASHKDLRSYPTGQPVYAPVCARVETTGFGAAPGQSPRDVCRSSGDPLPGAARRRRPCSTRLCRLPEESFDFLGYRFERIYSPRTERPYLGASPSRKSVQLVVGTTYA